MATPLKWSDKRRTVHVLRQFVSSYPIHSLEWEFGHTMMALVSLAFEGQWRAVHEHVELLRRELPRDSSDARDRRLERARRYLGHNGLIALDGGGAANQNGGGAR